METLSRLWMQGKTASQIAELLGEGVSRNAVIGKVHRLGLCSGENVAVRAAAIKSGAFAGDRDDESAPKRGAEEASVKPPAGAAPSAPANVKKRTVPISSSITIADLTDETCRWPVNEPDVTEFRYCGATVVRGAPYCARHSKLAYQPTRPVRRPPDRHALFPGLVAAAQKA